MCLKEETKSKNFRACGNRYTTKDGDKLSSSPEVAKLGSQIAASPYQIVNLLRQNEKIRAM